MAESEVKSFAQKLFPDFQYKEDIFNDAIQVKQKGVAEPPETITHQRSWVGVRYKRGNRVLTFFANAFAYGVLKPYPADESFFSEICGVLNTLASQYAALPAVRVGLRFINRVSVDFVSRPLTSVIRTLPSCPARLGFGDPKQFLYQDVYSNAETGVSVAVTRVYPANDPNAPQSPCAILDIDASVVPNQVVDADGYEKIVNDLRMTVNKVFFGTLSKQLIKELS